MHATGGSAAYQKKKRVKEVSMFYVEKPCVQKLFVDVLLIRYTIKLIANVIEVSSRVKRNNSSGIIHWCIITDARAFGR